VGKLHTLCLFQRLARPEGERMTKRSDRKLLRRLVRLGVVNIDSVEEAAQRQADMLRRLKQARVDPGYYIGLEDCGPDDCGRVNCAEACWFGARRRWLTEISAVQRLFQQTEISAVQRLFQQCQGPLYEVRIIRESWQQPIGHLKVGSITAAKQFNRRRLDTLYIPSAVAVGIYRVSIAPRRAGAHWISEMHEIVSYVEKEDLEQAFSIKRVLPGSSSNIFWAKPVSDLANTVSDILRPDLPIWQQPTRRKPVLVPTRSSVRSFIPGYYVSHQSNGSSATAATSTSID
jgi:hypothetical protein